MFVPSIYQQKILDWLHDGKGNACCNAVAGSGKSSTLKLAALDLAASGVPPSKIKIVVFGKLNSLDLINKLGSEWKYSVCTLHSAGWYLIRRHLNMSPKEGQIDGRKYNKVAEELGLIPSKRNRSHKLSGVANKQDFLTLIDLVRQTSSDVYPETIRDLCAHFHLLNVFDYEPVSLYISQALALGEQWASEGKVFDFTDQIWLPVKWQITSTHYQYLLVDECQDLNATQLQLVKQLACGSKTRLLFVGDPRQSIMGFAGADANSYENILKSVKGVELPLSLCYRCPKSHIRLVNKLFPDIPIQAADDAEEGEIIQLPESQLADNLYEGDMVISRKTAPLVSLCINLIAKGIAAKVKGRDIGKIIAKDLAEIARVPGGYSFSQFNSALRLYKKLKLEKFKGLDNEDALVVALNDRLAAIEVIHQNCLGATNIEDLIVYVESLFSDERSPVTLSTCHRAKGLEGDRIFIYKPNDLPMIWRKQKDWELKQEKNLLYVSLTRSKAELFIVGDADWLHEPEKLEEEEEALEERDRSAT